MRTFAEIYESLKDTLDYQVEEIKLAFTESVLLRMDELNLNATQLADRLGSSKPYVSKLLKGKNNFTFESLVKLAQALDCRVEAPLLVANVRQRAQVIQFVRPPKPKAGDFRPLTILAKPIVAGTQNDDVTPAPAAA